MCKQKVLAVVALVVVGAMVLAACAVPEPEVVVEEVEVTVPVEVPVTMEVTKIVAGTPEIVVEEVVVTATPEPEEPACEPAVEPPVILYPGRLLMAVNAVSPPYQWVNEQGELQGERIDLGEEIAKRLCLKPEWINVQWEATIPGLQGGRWDCVNSGMYLTEERAEIMEIIPYSVAGVALNVPVGNPVGISSAEDLPGLIVGLECPGFEFEEIKKLDEELQAAGNEAIDIRCFDTSLDARSALKAGQVNAVWSDSVVAKQYDDMGEFTMVPLPELGGGEVAKSLAFLNTELAEAVADIMNDMLEDGTYDAILDKWGSGKATELWDGWTGQFEVY
jgi:polar amino acid transport system substrate-binding protein